MYYRVLGEFIKIWGLRFLVEVRMCFTRRRFGDFFFLVLRMCGVLLLSSSYRRVSVGYEELVVVSWGRTGSVEEKV